jgi:hypothetical protein
MRRDEHLGVVGSQITEMTARTRDHGTYMTTMCDFEIKIEDGNYYDHERCHAHNGIDLSKVRGSVCTSSAAQ